MKKVNNTSVDIAEDNLIKFRRVFPQFIKDNQIDFDALKNFFDKEGLVAGEEKYNLNWAGKSQAFQVIRMPSVGTLTPQEKESINWQKTQNLFIEGDNLEVLKLLQKHYREKIKMIYIDPPYNTGKDFIYKDNFKENIADYYERTGQTKGGIKLTTNTESGGRYHSDWLTMMYPRLFLAKNLLRDDGVIFISIDDNEVHNLRHLMDEIFGQENFVTQIVWQRAYAPVSLNKYFSQNHDYIVCYSKNIESVSLNRLERTEKQLKDYKNSDNDPRGVWKLGNPSVGPAIERNIYEIKTPSGRILLPPKGRSWLYGQERFNELKKDNRIWFGKDGSSMWGPKLFLSEVSKGVIPLTLWTYKEVGHTQDAKKELKEIFDGNDLFETPKPESLIRRLVVLATNKEDIILDFFAGSGTTAHAVMDLNAQDGGNRKWILVQLPEATDEKSEARKAGFNTIAEIARERIRRAGKKINKGDVGFKSYALQKSNYRQWQILDEKVDEKKLKQQMKLILDKPLVDGFNEASVIYEILLKEGFSLNSQVQSKKLGGLTVWEVTDDDKKMVVSFAKSLTKDQIEKLNLQPEDTFVCFDSALDDTTKVNIIRNLNVKVI